MSDVAGELVAKNLDSECSHCGGGVGEFKASVWRPDKGERFFCHNDTRSCYNERRGSYFSETVIRSSSNPD